MNKQISTHKILILIIPMLLAFQNCSKVNFSSMPSVAPANTEAIRSLEPALAVRAVGCIQCHGNVSSNIVTDFGFGNSFYFGRNLGGALWGNGSPYTDHGKNLNTMTIPGDKQIFVPKAQLPADIAADLNLSTLADYIKSQLNLSANEGTKQVQVTEVNSVVIAAPTEQDIRDAFSLTSARMKFIKSRGIELSGLTDHGSYFQNSGPLVCDGDLVVEGPLYLKDLQVQTNQGCRIYVIGSVFENGAITYIGQSESRNLQITATRSINLGLGKSTNDDGSYCDPSGRLATGQYGNNSIVNRYTEMWTVPGQAVRGTQTPAEFGASVVADLHTLENGLGSVIKDAECSGGRSVAFDRLLLNAPVVMSRYLGNFKGTIIAEFALMSLGQFKFEFDPIFRDVDVLPQLAQAKFIGVQH